MDEGISNSETYVDRCPAKAIVDDVHHHILREFGMALQA